MLRLMQVNHVAPIAGTYCIVPRNKASAERQLSQPYSWAALLLCAIAGCGDAAGYLMLKHVYTSHMSGNSIDLGVRLATGSVRDMLHHFLPIVPFFVGVVCGLLLIERLMQVNINRIFAVIACVEAVLLLMFMFTESQPREWLLVFPALAFGVQNAMLRSVGHHKIRTTYVTGMLTNSAQGVAEAITALRTRDAAYKEKLSDALFYASLWFFFAAGGVAGAQLQVHFGRFSLLAPACALFALALVDVFVPLSG